MKKTALSRYVQSLTLEKGTESANSQQPKKRIRIDRTFEKNQDWNLRFRTVQHHKKLNANHNQTTSTGRSAEEKNLADSIQNQSTSTGSSTEEKSLANSIFTNISGDSAQPIKQEFIFPSENDFVNGTKWFKNDLYQRIEEATCNCCGQRKSIEVHCHPLDPTLKLLKVTQETNELPFITISKIQLHVHNVDIPDTNRLKICVECYVSLTNEQIPRFSILNFIYPERVPDVIEDLSIPEGLLIAKVFHRSIVWESSYAHSKLNHHVVCFDAKFSSVNVLPRPSHQLSSMMQVVFIPEQNSSRPIPSRIPKITEIRKQNCLDAVIWLKTNNRRYMDIEITPNFLDESRIEIGIENTVTADNLENYIPSHSSRLNGAKYEEYLTLKMKDKFGMEIEEITRSGLFTSAIEQSAEKIAIAGSVNTWLKNVEQGFTAVVHSSEVKNIADDMEWIVDCYPILFPEGNTGPSRKRPIPLTFSEWIQYWLNNYDDRFANHYDFIFALYDISQRRKVLEQSKFDITGYPSIGIKPSDIAYQLDRVKQQKSINHDGVRQLLSNTRTKGSLISHTSQRKLVLRANIYGIIVKFGWPTFFVTLNPNDLYSPILNLHNAKEEEYNNLLDRLVDEKSEQSAFFNSNPVKCAKYFHSVVETFLKNILGWDDKEREYSKSMFGTVVSHFGVVEQQQRKQLHIHMLIWVDGLTDYDDFLESMENEKYSRSIIDYLNRLMSCSMRKSSESLKSEKDGRQYLCPELETDFYKIFDEQLDWIQMSAQVHICSTYHCLKRKNKCRYNFPKALSENSTFDKNLKTISLRRNNYFLNTCLAPVGVVGRFNTDIQFLPGNGDPRIARYIAYYISNYTSKEEASTVHLLEYMNKKLADIQTYRPEIIENEKKLFGSLLSSTVQKFAASNDVGAVEVASTLLDLPDHYTNFFFSSINWKNWDLWLCRELKGKYDCHSYSRLQDTKNQYFTHLQRSFAAEKNLSNLYELFDMKNRYLKRNTRLEFLSLYEIETKYQFKCYSCNDDLPDNFFLLRGEDINNMDNVLIYGHQEQKYESVPTLPWFNTKSTAHGVGTEGFARIMMLLFRPFRTGTDLYSHPGKLFLELYDDWKSRINVNSIPYKYMIHLEKDGNVMKEAATERVRNMVQNTVVKFSAQDSSEQIIEWRRVEFHLPQMVSKVTARQMIKNTIMAQKELDESFLNRGKTHFLYPITNTSIEVQRDSYYCREKLLEILENEKTNSTCNKQWKVVTYIANHIYQNSLKKEIQPVRMLILGEGGTGKSWIIRVIQKLFSAVNIPYCTAAPTGRAALGVNGDTIDSLYGFSRQKGSKKKYEIPDNSELNGSRYILIDEISMVSKEKLNDMNRCMATLDWPIMGNISYIFFGDFLQFSPVAARSLINPVTTSREILANAVMAAIDYIVELTDQKRQTDVKYLELLRNLRNFTPTMKDVQYLQMNCSMPPIVEQTDKWLFTAEGIVSQNLKRIKWNYRSATAFARYHKLDMYIIQAIDYIDCEYTIAVEKELELQFPEYLQKKLSLVIGMPLVITRNIYKKLGIVNGTVGNLKAFHQDELGNLEAIEINFPTLNFQAASLERNCLLFSRVKAEGTIKFGKTRIKYQREQFPVYEGFCLTDYKKQGATVQTHAIMALDGNGMSSYVKLSRTKTSAQTFIDGEITLQSLKMSKPSGYEAFRLIVGQKQESFFSLDDSWFLERGTIT